MSSTVTKASSVRSKLLLRSGNWSRLTLWWVTADQWLRLAATNIQEGKKDKLFADHVTRYVRYVKRTIW